MNQRRLSPIRAALILLPLALFACLRIPALIHQAGMQDEQWFSVPGLTVWREGIPRIPYVPTRNRETLFENADVCLMALPPGLFYVQAPFFAIFPAGYATARIPVFLAALATILITFWGVKRLGGSDAAACVAAVIVALSRPLMFTGLTARPDLLSALAGWLSLLVAWEMLSKKKSFRWATLCGALCGLAGLFHPFALVFALQSGVTMLVMKEPRASKLKRSLCFVAGNLALIGLWAPLIAIYPYEFKSQFFANVLDRAGPGLPSRLLWPVPSMAHHTKLLFEFAGPYQCVLVAFALLGGSVLFWRTHSLSKPQRVGFLVLVWSSIYLTATVAGLHPTKGYWVYPFVWIVIMAAAAYDAWFRNHLRSQSEAPLDQGRSTKRSLWIPAVSVALCIALLLPGAGLKTTWVYLRHWKSPELHAPTFIQNVLQDLPHDGVFYADLSYVFDVYLSGRETRLCQEREQYWGSKPLDYEYLILSWEGEDAGWAQQYNGTHLRRIGNRERPQNCFVDLYRQSSTPSPVAPNK